MFETPLDDFDGWEPPDEELSWTDSDGLTSAIAQSPGAGLLLHLEEIDPAGLTADEAVMFAQQVDRLAAHVAGLQVKARADVAERLVAHFDGGQGEVIEQAERADRAVGFVTAEMLASGELAAALRMTRTATGVALDLARDLAGPMRPLWDALDQGHVSAKHVELIARELSKLPLNGNAAQAQEFAAQCARILGQVLPYAATHTPPQSARRTKGHVLAEDPRGAAERRRDAAEREHGVWLTPTENGSCEINAVLPLAHGTAVMDAINSLAKSPRFETSVGCVTKGQRRVAALTTLVLGNPGSVASVEGPVADAKLRASVNVVVPLATLLGVSEQGGTVAGEPVTADVIRDLLIDADPKSTLRRLVTDSAGCVVDAGRSRYAISEAQRHLIGLRDRVCRFPGCIEPAVNCEVDHARPWNRGGRTDLCNLGPLCKHHHQLKTFGGWLIIDSQRSGACTWRSPLGRIYEHAPPDLLPPEPIPPPDEVPEF